MVLEVVKQCCLAIRSEKVTERKNGSERLGHLLDNSAITTALDGRPADSFNWSQVFFSARKYFILEARKLEDEERNRPNVSQTVLRNRETHKRTAASLPLLVLKKGCRKTPHIPPQPVIELVLKVLSKREPYLLENFAKEFLLMSVKFVLRFPHFYAQMTTANWKDLLKICIWLYEKNMKNVDPLKVFEVMSGVVQRCQSRVVPHRGPNTALDILRSLPAFLRRVLLSQRVAQHFNMWPTLLHLLLAFVSAMACELRRVVCALGEDTFDVVLKMWDKRPSPHHTNWLQYMTLLVAIHNPQKDGEVREASHYSADRARWDRCLRHLYQLLHDHLASSGGKDLRDLTEPLLNLTARVSLQVFSGCEATGFVDVTQLTATASSSKRRKIEVGLTPLTELLKKEGTGTHTLPWYKLLLTLLTNHCKFFTSARCLELLQALKQVLAGCSDRVVQDAVMRCLSVLAVQHSKATATSRREGEGEGEREGDNLWMSVWDLTLRIVSGRRGNSLGLNLMGTLIWTGLCTPNAASFKLFHKNYLCVSEEALWALLGLLTTVPLPTHFQNEPAWLQKIEDKEPKERLILFALSTPEEEGSGGSGGGSGVFPSLHSPTLLAKVLWCLCLRDPTAVKVNHHRHHHHYHQHHHHHHHHQQTLIEKVDDLCHLSTFTCDLPVPSQVTQVTQQDPSPSSSPSHTPGGGGGGGGGGGKEKNVLAEKLQVMIQGVMSFAEKVEGESDSEEPECLQALVHLAHLMALLYVHTGDNRLERKFCHTLRLVAAALEKVSVSEGVSRWQTLHPVLASLTAMLEGPEELAGEVSKGRHKQILSSLPPALPAVLLALLEKRCTKTPSASTTASTQMARGTFSQDSWDDFDIGFDDTVGGSSSAVHQDLLDFEDTSNHAEGDQRDEDVVVDDLTTLGLRDQCVVVAGRWLVAVAAAVPPGGGGGGDTQHTFLHKAVDVVLQMSQCSAPDMGDVAVLLALVQSLFLAEYNEDNILDGLEVISNIAKVHCGVAQVARCSLLYLADLVRKHGSSLSPDIRTSIVTLVKAFATKHQQGNYDRSVTKKIFDVNVELTKVDPKRTWSSYEIPDHDRCGKLIDLLNDNTSELRLYAALSLHLLVGSGGGGGVVDAAHQDTVFEEVYQIVLESLNVSDTVSEELVVDERENRCVSFLVSLGCVVAASPYLESKALFALCLSNTHHNIDASLLLQLLTCISTAKRTTPQHLLATHLQYLTSQWLQHRHSITAFPCRAFGFDTTDTFLAEHRVALLPVLLECDAKEGVEQLAQGCDGGLRGLFRAAFPFLMARIFPYIAGESAANEGMRFSEAKLQAGRRQYKQVERTFGTEVFSTLLTTHIGDLTLHLLRLTHDPQPWVEGEVIVPPPPPAFTPEVIQATMKFVGGIFRKDGQLLVVVCGRRALHGVVQGVVQAMGRSASPQEARQAITAAATLVDAALPVLDTALVGTAPYLLRMLLHLLTAHLEPLGHLGPHLAHRCLALLHRVVAAALRCLASDLVPAVPILFGRLLPLLTRPGTVGGAGAAGVLGLLLDCDNAAMQAALAALPALPDLPHCPALATLREKHRAVVAACRGQPDLCDEMDNFLATPSQDVATHHLSHLAGLLRDNRGQVAELFLGARPGRESRGHRLAQRLVSLATSKGGAVAQEVCRCLGELGPLSLDTPVFLVSEGGATPGGGEGEVDLGYVGRLLLAMHGYLACGEVEVEGAASQALQGVLATQQGQEALEDLPATPREELRPLCPEGRPRAGAGNSGAVDAVAYQQIVGAGGVWEVGPGLRGYEAWVCGLARCLITAGCGLEVAPPLLPLCALRPEFSALALPLLVHSALATDPGGRRDVLSRQMSAFFACHSQDVGGRGGRAAVQASLCVVEHLRMQRPPALGRRATTPFDTNHWLALNYLQVAGAAQHCGAHFSALLYLQLHHEQMLRDTAPERGEAAITRRLQGAPLARAVGHPEATEAGQLLLQVCGALEDGAGVQGCIAAGVMQDTAARLTLCHHRGDWLAALALCDTAHHRAGLHHTLAALGLHHSLRGLLASGDTVPGSVDPGEGGQARWETSWRLCRWEEEDAVAVAAASQVGVGEEGRPHRHIYQALRCLHHHDLPDLHHHTTAARTAITTTLSLGRAESTSLMYPLLTHLQILNELEEMGQCVADLSCPVSGARGLAGVEAAWRGREAMGVVGYRHKEEVMAARVAMLKAVSGVWRDNGRQEEVERMLHRTLLAKSKLARSSGDRARGVVGSEAAILWASQLAVPPELANLTRLEEAEVARAAGDVQRAKHTLTTLLQDVQEGSGQEKVLSQALTFLGELLMEARSLPPHTIIDDYFNRATATLLHHDTDKEAQDILEMSQHRLAQYADQLYQQVHSHLEGDASQAKRATVQRSRAELQRLENLLKGCRENTADWKELSKKTVLLRRNINIDVEFLSELEREEQTYLVTALKAHLSCLAMTSTHHLLAYRVVALWLNNSHKEEVNAMMSEHGSRVKSHHFVPLLYQLVARLSTHNAHLPFTFPSVLSQLLLRVCGDHPHHTLPVIFALAHAHADDQFQQTGRRKEPKVTEEDRVQAAKQLVERLKKTPALREHVVEFERISLAYLSLANWCGTLPRLLAGHKVDIPSSQPLQKLPPIHHTASLTQPLPVQPSAQYSPPLLKDWEGAGMCVGGINAPIRLTVRTCDGTKNFELLKGRDDVRQDAVMEQVFGIVNELLRKSPETRDSGLSMRTYQVVPLSQRSGLIQWCKNTQAFGRYLIGADKKSGAHATYFPKDYTAKTCLDKMKNVKRNSADDKLRVFVDILEHFHPVFQHFFLEQYRSPHSWLQHRLAYTKSVATTSIIGYIVGLGDRHPENILLDKTTAELIHIDLGIAFELGKVLPTPETVPFRMTQDMVAGLGVLGIEGPLRGWCEATLRVLRDSGEVLVTLVEVLRHDPLHQWTLTPQQAAKLQEEEEDQEIGCDNSVSMAERVVLKMRQKLVGMEEGFPSSVPDQVTRLLQDATSPSNLCRLFAGWQAYV